MVALSSLGRQDEVKVVVVFDTAELVVVVAFWPKRWWLKLKITTMAKKRPIDLSPRLMG
jgi:hypothetical protein